MSPSQVSFAQTLVSDVSLSQPMSFLFYFLSLAQLRSSDKMALVGTWHPAH